MAQGPVPSYAEFLGGVTKPECFTGPNPSSPTIPQAIVESVLEDCTDEVVSAFGDRATPPILTWDGACKRAVICLSARVLMGHRGYKKDPGGDSEFVALAKRADEWLELVAAKRRHPTFTDSTVGLRPDTPRISSSLTADAWARPRYR